MNKLKDVWNKFKSVKHFQIYIALLFAIIVCVIYFSFFKNTNTDKSTNLSTDANLSTDEYVETLENKLCNVLSNISGVGQVDVVITLQSGFSYVYATDTETKTTTSGTTETTITREDVLLVSNEPVIIKEVFPEIKGVVVVAKGAENIGIKLNILSAVETALEIEAKDITILH
ncbi:MAG: hypothetical protein J6J24_01770 [Clostridia bacterium]|nr:hypothetical protein [Clostridia bacterium]